MSLLMEALKKAERAKQKQTVPPASQGSQPGDAAETPSLSAVPSHGLSLLPREDPIIKVDTTAAGDLPSISTAHDASSAIPDLAPLPTEKSTTASDRAETAAPGLEPGPNQPSLSGEAHVSLTSMSIPDAEPKAQPQPSARHIETPNKAPPQNAAAQQKAKTVFSAKQPARSRTLLLTITAAAVAISLAGFGIYYWQITSTSTMLLPVSTPQPTTTPAIRVDAGVPQQQGTPAAPAQDPSEKNVPVMALASPPAVSIPYDPARAGARSETAQLKENPAIRIRQSMAAGQLNPTLSKAYQSFLSGDTGTSQQLYHKVLQQEPNNRDALLGLAAITLKQKHAGQAAAYYGKLIELDPADPEALAGLIGLQGQSDPAQSESRLKKALIQNPQAGAAHFALGNLYTQQSRWPEAQQSYFRAYSSAPGNADYAFNLAVSLDHLNQGKLALDFYQRALAQPGPASFDKSSVQTRIKELLPLWGE